MNSRSARFHPLFHPPATGVLLSSAMTELIGIAAVAVVAWFAAGTIWNVRTGRGLMRWMQEGLPLLGTRTTVRWLGSTVVEMVIGDARAPFTGATLVIFLEPRDLPWWPISRARGRRDTLIVRAALRQAPALEFEALDPRSWSGRDALLRVPHGWLMREGSIAVHYERTPALECADALIARAQGAGLRLARLSVRRTEPHFQLHVSLPDRKRPAREFFETVHALSELALK
jgi:hypothetical protein